MSKHYNQSDVPRIKQPLVVESNVPVPPEVAARFAKPGRSVYPFDRMKKGDSFFIVCEQAHQNEMAKRARSSAQQYASRIKATDLRFGVEPRTEEDRTGVRVWRLS